MFWVTHPTPENTQSSPSTLLLTNGSKFAADFNVKFPTKFYGEATQILIMRSGLCIHPLPDRTPV